MICNNCKANIQEGFRFCPNCGATVGQKSLCPGCGKETSAGWVACAYCGYRLTNQQPLNIPHHNIYNEPKHGYYHRSSSNRSHGGYQRKKGFLGRLFSS